MRFRIEHRTDYAYTEAVRLDPHVLRLTPRSGPNKTVLRRELIIRPEPSGLVTVLDAEGNQVEFVWFAGPTDTLSILLRCEVETHLTNPFDYLLTEANRALPNRYAPEEAPVLAPYLAREAPSRLVDDLAAELAGASGHHATRFLDALNRYLHERFGYEVREIGPPLGPEETVRRGSGACRDLAVLFIDACRAVGIPARFVSGYQQGDPEMTQRHLHAWPEVYLAGAGWRGYDPTLGLAVADGHIALAASRSPETAAPVSGAFWSLRAQSILTHRLELAAG